MRFDIKIKNYNLVYIDYNFPTVEFVLKAQEAITNFKTEEYKARSIYKPSEGLFRVKIEGSDIKAGAIEMLTNYIDEYKREVDYKNFDL